MVKDRLVAGGLAGVIGGLVQNLYGLLVKAIGITDRSFSDFAKIIIMFKPYQGVLGFLVGLFAHTLVGLMFGVIFTYIISLTSSKYYLLKGLTYGGILWFLLSGFGTIFKLPLFKDIPPNAAIIDFMGGLIYGIVTAYMLKILEQRTKLL